MSLESNKDYTNFFIHSTSQYNKYICEIYKYTKLKNVSDISIKELRQIIEPYYVETPKHFTIETGTFNSCNNPIECLIRNCNNCFKDKLKFFNTINKKCVKCYPNEECSCNYSKPISVENKLICFFCKSEAIDRFGKITNMSTTIKNKIPYCRTHLNLLMIYLFMYFLHIKDIPQILFTNIESIKLLMDKCNFNVKRSSGEIIENARISVNGFSYVYKSIMYINSDFLINKLNATKSVDINTIIDECLMSEIKCFYDFFSLERFSNIFKNFEKNRNFMNTQEHINRQSEINRNLIKLNIITENNPLIIQINNYEFKLLYKRLYFGRYVAGLCSNKYDSTGKKMKDTLLFFEVYTSISEMGCWKFLKTRPSDGALDKFDNYLQSTIIHFELQQFIWKHYNDLPDIDELKTQDFRAYLSIIDNITKCYDNTSIVERFKQLVTEDENKRLKFIIPEDSNDYEHGYLNKQKRQSFSDFFENKYKILNTSIIMSYNGNLDYIKLKNLNIYNVLVQNKTNEKEQLIFQVGYVDFKVDIESANKQNRDRGFSHYINQIEDITNIRISDLKGKLLKELENKTHRTGYYILNIIEPNTCINENGLYNNYYNGGIYTNKPIEYKDRKRLFDNINHIGLNVYYYIANENTNLFPIKQLIEYNERISADLYSYKYLKYKNKYISNKNT
jgi:hypothetical protein